jgi:hypothetical protein
MANTEGALVYGAYKYGNIPDVLFKYDRDKDYAGMVIYIQREIAALTYLLRERLPRVKVSSHTPILPEVSERDYIFSLAAQTAEGTENNMEQTIVLSNADARNLQKNDFLQVRGVFYDNAGAWSTTFGATSGPQEVVRVIGVGVAGATTTNVLIRRGWGGDGTGTPSTLATSTSLVMQTSAVSEGSRSRISIGKNITTEQNYIQTFREPYEATDVELDEDTFFKERPEQINANLASMLLMKKIEFGFWSGAKAMATDETTGKVLFTTGGVIPFVPRDATHQINFGSPITAPAFNSVIKDVFSLGGSTEKWLFGGYSFITALNNAFDNKVQLNMPMVDRYHLNIKSFTSSIGGTLHVLPSFALTEMGYDWDAFVLDFGTPSAPYFQYMFMDDIYINTGPNGKGIQANDEFIRKEEFVGKLGLIRRASQYQAHIYGVTQSL